jgi:hypothetical protein
LATAACAVTALTLAPRQLLVLPVDAIRDRAPLAAELLRRAGPSAGRWRLYTNTETTAVPMRASLGERVAGFVSTRRSLLPQFEVVERIEGASQYFTIGDESYGRALRLAPGPLFDALGVRFALAQPYDATPSLARKLGFERLPQGYWLGEYPARPRAFLVGEARALTRDGEASRLQESGFEARRSASVPLEAAAAVAGLGDASPLHGAVQLHRPTSDELDLQIQSPRPALLLLGEHFDDGWRASVDGTAAPVVRADLAVLAVPVPAGRHQVTLRFVARGLAAGLAALAAAVAGLLAWATKRHFLTAN